MHIPARYPPMSSVLLSPFHYPHAQTLRTPSMHTSYTNVHTHARKSQPSKSSNSHARHARRLLHARLDHAQHHTTPHIQTHHVSRGKTKKRDRGKAKQNKKKARPDTRAHPNAPGPTYWLTRALPRPGGKPGATPVRRSEPVRRMGWEGCA